MSHAHYDHFSFQAFRHTLVHRPLLWLGPAVLVTGCALAFALFHQRDWVASQSVLVRDEVTDGQLQPGRFGSQDDMKTAQETVLELATSYRVCEATLKKVGYQGRRAPKGWPNADEVETLQAAIDVRAPRGAEFGRTEVFYLNVKNKDAERAVSLADALYHELANRLSELRDNKASSLTVELQRSVDVAQEDLAKATKALVTMERKVGSDLSELRILSDSNSGTSTLHSTLTQIRDELRAAQQQQLESQQLLVVLTQTQGDPDKLVATPSRLLASQPGIDQLKQGLIQAQLRTSSAQSMMSAQHPKVIAAQTEENAVRSRLREELSTAIEGVDIELNLSKKRIAALKHQQAEVTNRLNRLASMRADYHNLVEEVSQRTNTLNKVQDELTEAKASLAAAHSASLLARLDEPRTGSSPEGPSRSMILLLGMVCGMIGGLGIVVLFGSAPPRFSPTANHADKTSEVVDRDADPYPSDSFEDDQFASPRKLLDSISDILLGDPTPVNH